MTQGYQCLGWTALGLADGRTLMLRPWDYAPPSWASAHSDQVAQLLGTGAIVAVPTANAARLALADAAAASGAQAPGTSSTVDGVGAPVNERFNASQLWDPKAPN